MLPRKPYKSIQTLYEVLYKSCKCRLKLQGKELRAMARHKQSNGKSSEIEKDRPAFTPEGRENQMIALAINLAEEQMLNGSASSQVITHYLKLAATKERARLELEILERQRELIEAKTAALRAEQSHEELYKKAIDAMRLYTGRTSDDPNLY